MHPLYDYLCQKLDEMIIEKGIVVFYDPRRQFEPLFDRELKARGTGYSGLPQVLVNERPAFVARHQGSFFALRGSVEPIAELDNPEPLIVYLPGVERDRRGSVLLELEKSGTPYEPQLRQVARNVLRKRFTDGQIDEILKPADVSYTDIVAVLRQVDEGQPASILRTIFDGAQSETLITRWLADEGKDPVISEKNADDELYKLIGSRLGLLIAENTTIPETRDRLLRYILVNEFRSNLGCDPPQAVSMVPKTTHKDHLERIRYVAERLRHSHAERYEAFADKVENDLSLVNANIEAVHLGNTDTFRFEERALLAYASGLIRAGQYVRALETVEGHSRSFWVERDVRRRAQWETCGLMAELGREIERVRPMLGTTNGNPTKWVQAYAAEDGWYRADELQRRLETWVAKMDSEPASEEALAVVRREHEQLLKKMADGFAKALAKAGWTISGALHQTRIYPDVVKAMGGRVGYFFVDAMRFEMGVELARQLDGARDLTVRPAVAVTPTITPVGMAALLPGASASFSVIENKNKLAAEVEGSVMFGLSDRLRFLKAKFPDTVDIPLGKLLSTPLTKLGKLIAGRALIVVRSQEIDALGENIDELTARAAMESVIGNIARAIRKLASVGVESFVITADHGHQFSIRKEDDMKTDSPSGDTVDMHRRCWIGHGGNTPPGCLRVSGAELGYDTNLDFVFPMGLGVFRTGGGLSFHHGGVSLQEMVIPVVSLRMPVQETQSPAGKAAHLRGLPDKITNRTFGVRVVSSGDLFTTEPLALRVILIAGSEQVGQAGMALGGEIDRSTAVLQMNPNSEANVGIMLTRDDCNSVRVVLLDPATDAVLDQSGEIPVILGI